MNCLSVSSPRKSSPASNLRKSCLIAVVFKQNTILRIKNFPISSIINSRTPWQIWHIWKSEIIVAIDLEKGFFFDVLQSLDTLEELKFEHLSVSDKDEKQCCMIPSRLDTVKIYRLKSLIIHICASGTVAAMINCNDLFESILKACPIWKSSKWLAQLLLLVLWLWILDSMLNWTILESTSFVSIILVSRGSILVSAWWT